MTNNKFYFGLEEDQVTLAFKATIVLAKIVIKILCPKTHRIIMTVSHVQGKDLLDKTLRRLSVHAISCTFKL